MKMEEMGGEGADRSTEVRCRVQKGMNNDLSVVSGVSLVS